MSDNRIHLYDIVMLSQGAMSESFLETHVVKEEYNEVLRRCCGFIEAMADNMQINEVSCQADESDQVIRIDINCVGLTVTKSVDEFFRLCSHLVSISFQSDADGALMISLVFPGIWVPK